MRSLAVADPAPRPVIDEPVDRVGASLARAALRQERLLVVYLTVGDPLTDPVELALAVAAAGADVLELGIPTPTTDPRGAEMARSFHRAGRARPAQVWAWLAELRAALPATPLLPLVFPETVADLGWDRLIADSLDAGADGLVLTRPDGPDEVDRVASAGLSAIPLIQSTVDTTAVRRLEAPASHLTYRNLAGRTGDPLDLASACRITARLAATAAKPFLAGFGIRNTAEIRALAPNAAGLVIGSQLLRVLTGTEPAGRLDAAHTTVRRWKAATVLRPGPHHAVPPITGPDLPTQHTQPAQPHQPDQPDQPDQPTSLHRDLTRDPRDPNGAARCAST